MTKKERLAKMIEAGAALQMLPPGHPMSTFLLAGALWLHNPTRLRWCAVFPEDQHHIHEVPYDRAVVVHDRDIAFYRGGRLIMYITPYEETEEDIESMRENLRDWQYQLTRFNNAEQFAEFLKTA